MRALLLALLITGCSGIPVKCEIPEKEIKLEHSYYTECDKLPLVKENATFIDILSNHKEILEVYNRCQLKQHDSVTVLKVLTNRKEDK